MDLAAWAAGFAVALSPENLALCALWAFVGTLIGVLPGIGPAATLALLLPLTFALEPAGAIIMMAAIYYGAQYGGSTAAILLNVPGECSGVVTAMDGHRMALAGRAPRSPLRPFPRYSRGWPRRWASRRWRGRCLS